MKCPNCTNKTRFSKCCTREVSTIIEVVDGKLEYAASTIIGKPGDVEPQTLMCTECQFEGAPHLFGHFNEASLKKQIRIIVNEALETDGLTELPDQLAELMFPGVED